MLALRYLPISPNLEKMQFEQNVRGQMWKEYIRELIRINKDFQGFPGEFGGTGVAVEAGGEGFEGELHPSQLVE